MTFRMTFRKHVPWPKHPSKEHITSEDWAFYAKERQDQFELDWQREFPDDPLGSENFEVNERGNYVRETTRVAFRLWCAGFRRRASL